MKPERDKDSKSSGRGDPWKKARRVFARQHKRLLRRVGVVGVDLGIKRARGQLIPGPCIRVHVAKKLSEDKLHARRLLPRLIEGVPVDVVETGFRLRLACPNVTMRYRTAVNPLVGGCSIGRFGEREFGTLGAIAVDSTGARGGLTCSHVCGGGDQVIQPHQLGRAIGVVTNDAQSANMDAAFITFNGSRPSAAEVLNYGPVIDQPLDVDKNDLPLQVELVGACSGRTQGKVVATDFHGWVKDANDEERWVSGMMGIEADGVSVFARAGDSGGGIIRDYRFVGLLLAADEGREGAGLAIPMSRVLSQLGVRLL